MCPARMQLRHLGNRLIYGVWGWRTNWTLAEKLMRRFAEQLKSVEARRFLAVLALERSEWRPHASSVFYHRACDELKALSAADQGHDWWSTCIYLHARALRNEQQDVKAEAEALTFIRSHEGELETMAQAGDVLAVTFLSGDIVCQGDKARRLRTMARFEHLDSAAIMVTLRTCSPIVTDCCLCSTVARC